MFKLIKYQLKPKWKKMKPLVIYTSGGNCGLCKVSQAYMERNGVPYIEKIAVITKEDQKIINQDQKKGAKIVLKRQDAYEEMKKKVKEINPNKKTYRLPLLVDPNLKQFQELSGGIQHYVKQNYLEVLET